jgi:hypothetical protein
MLRNQDVYSVQSAESQWRTFVNTAMDHRFRKKIFSITLLHELLSAFQQISYDIYLPVSLRVILQFQHTIVKHSSIVNKYFVLPIAASVLKSSLTYESNGHIRSTYRRHEAKLITLTMYRNLSHVRGPINTP